MAYYTEETVRAEGLSILDAPVSTGEAVGAAFRQSFATSLTPLAIETGNLAEQEQGSFRYDYARQDTVQVATPETPLLSKEQAEQQVKDSGLDLDIPDGGIRQGSLSLLLDRRRAERERSILLQGAPSAAAPAVLLASFAAQAVDPINVASAFIPVFGEARYTAMLAQAVGTAGRLGVRAGVGVLEGAVGAAVLEPAVYTFSQQLQDDYDITDSLTNIAFGAALGGSLRGIGGIVKDRYFPSRELEVGDSLDDLPTPDKAALSKAGYVDPAGERLMLQLEQGLEVERAKAVKAATDELLPQIRAELEPIAAGRLSNVADLKAELGDVDKALSELPQSAKAKAKEFQAQGMKRKEAERAARDSIAAEQERLGGRRVELQEALEGNRSAELARSDISLLERGEVPERYRSRIDTAAEGIRAGLQRSKLSEALSPIPFADKLDVFQKTMGAAMNGLEINPRAFIDLKSPDAAVRQSAIDAIRTAPRRMPAEFTQASTRATADLKAAPKDDQALQDSLLDFDEASAKEVAEQTGYNLKNDAELKEAEQFASEVDAYQAVYKANALCMLRG